MVYYAHSNTLDKANWQSLKEHLTKTADIAEGLGEDAGVAEFARLAALLHDVGKYSLAFQRRLDGSARRVDHATAGAKEVMRLFEQKPKQAWIGELLAYCIAGHHGGLPDGGNKVIDTPNDVTLQGRLKRTPEPYEAYKQEFNPANLFLPGLIPIKTTRQECGFSLSFFTRMVYSTLVDADFLDTETVMPGNKKTRGQYDSIQTLAGRYNQYLERFTNPQNPIHTRRTQILNACLEKASLKPGFFKLTVPTGGGKTYASMAFALNHAVANGLKRVIYVIPYTSIIEQNAAVFKDCLGQNNVLEHHSNFDWDAKKDAQEEASDENIQHKLKWAAENWDIPIVVTTNVQFFESLFANRSTRCRKLHNIAKSVIIFDEAQMLPRDYLKPCLHAVHELVTNYGASTIFCTATQPSLEQIVPELQPVTELAPEPQALYQFFKRVQIQILGKTTDEDLLQRIHQYPQALCIVNTRKHAKGLYQCLEGEGSFHLSTLMCAAHRKAVIATIRKRLKDGLPCRVISTQIMEAGIDVDFPVGFRAMAGLDSVIQAAGRVNREGKQARGTLFVFEPDSQLVKRTPAYIAQGAAVTNMIFRNFADDPSSLQAIQAFYDQLYDLQGENAFDSQKILAEFIPAQLNFRTAAENFKLIEDDTVAVVIPFNAQAKDLLKQAQIAEFPMQFARQLQPYTVNIYEPEFKALQQAGAIDTYNDSYEVVHEDFYNKYTGLNIPESGNETAFFG